MLDVTAAAAVIFRFVTYDGNGRLYVWCFTGKVCQNGQYGDILLIRTHGPWECAWCMMMSSTTPAETSNVNRKQGILLEYSTEDKTDSDVYYDRYYSSDYVRQYQYTSIFPPLELSTFFHLLSSSFSDGGG